MVGASTAYLEAAADKDAAFFDFFQVSVLDKLSQNDLMTCLRRLAKVRGKDGSNVVNAINEDAGRIRTLYDLTGGNPRTLILLYLLLEMDGEGDVFSDLERLLDQVTVLYKARVEELSPQARVVFAGGCVANFTASRISYVAQRQMQVWTPHGFASIDFATGQATLVHPSEAILDRVFERFCIGK